MMVKEVLTGDREGPPREAFALIGDEHDQSTWRLLHHRRSIFRALEGKLNIERTVDWERMPAAVATLSRRRPNRERVEAGPEELLQAARHLAAHYLAAGKPLPDILAALG
ncbi:MAG: hypothetical protein V1780_05140 [Chloroflexota bacterium]